MIVHNLLVDVVGEWLPELVVMAIELQPNPFPPVTERVLHLATARLRRTRFIRARELSVRIDGVGVDLQLTADASLHLDDPQYPVIITRSGQDGIDWQVLDAIAESVAAVVGHASAAQTLRMAAQYLDRLTGGELRGPSDSELAGTFRVSEHRIAEMRTGLHAEGEGLAHALVVPVAVIAGDAAARELEGAEVVDGSELLKLLTELLGNETATELVAAAEQSEGQDGLRRSLKLPLGDFNRALIRFGRPPIHYIEQHDAAFRNYVARGRGAILDQLRVAFLQEYSEFGDLSRYSKLRTMDGLDPDPSWLDDVEVPDDQLMHDQVLDWFTANDIPANDIPADGGGSLSSLESVNRLNEAVMDSALDVLSRIVAAWCGRHDAGRPEKWQDLTAVRTALQSSGCLDFAELTATDLARWAAVLGLWPDGMRASADPLELGLSEHDLAEASSESTNERERRARERRLIRLDDRPFSVEPEGLRSLAQEVRQSVSPGLLAMSARRVPLVPLGNPKSRSDGSRRSGGGRGGGSLANSEPSSEQNAAIGLIGETVAFEWLTHRYPEANEASWVSKNRTFLLGGYPGDDGLGYDFEVALRGRTLHFEVKATQGEVCEFEMGESELRAAKAAPRGTYRILFLRRVLDSTLRQLDVLPNPLEAAYRASFRQVNEGIKLRFALGDIRPSPGLGDPGRGRRGHDRSNDGGVDADT